MLPHVRAGHIVIQLKPVNGYGYIVRSARGSRPSITARCLAMDAQTRLLAAACATNNVAKAFCALMNGADPVSHGFERPPIVAAAAAGHKYIVKLLLFADGPQGVAKSTPLSVLGDALVAACTRPHGQGARALIVRMLLRRGASPDSRDRAGTALCHAVVARNIGAMIMLLTYGADANAPGNEPRSTPPVLIAITRLYLEEAYVLLANGADVNVATPWMSVLAAAVHTGVKGLVRVCIEACGANVNMVLAATGRTALHHAAIAGDTAVVRVLLGARAHPDAVYDRNGDTPMTLAAAAGHAGTIEALGRAGADANLPRQHDHATPLAIALLGASAAAISSLLDMGGDPYAVSRSWGGRTVYELALENAEVGVVAMLYDSMPAAPPAGGVHVRTAICRLPAATVCHTCGVAHVRAPAAPLRIYRPADDPKMRTVPAARCRAAAAPGAECIVCRTRRPITDNAERAMWCRSQHNAFAPCGHGSLLCGMCCAVLPTCPYCRADAFVHGAT